MTTHRVINEIFLSTGECKAVGGVGDDGNGKWCMPGDNYLSNRAFLCRTGQLCVEPGNFVSNQAILCRIRQSCVESGNLVSNWSIICRLGAIVVPKTSATIMLGWNTGGNRAQWCNAMALRCKSIGTFHYRQRNQIKLIMISFHGNVFRVTGPLWGKSTDHQWISFTKVQ